MFKYFGLKEILYGLKKFSIWIVIATLAFGVIGFVIKNNEISSSEVVKDEFYSTSYSYIISSIKDTSTQAQSISDRACAATIAALLQTDSAKEYVYNKLVAEYENQDILKYTDAKTSVDDMDYRVLDDCLKVTVVGESSLLNITITVKLDSHFSEKTAESFNEYFAMTLSHRVPTLKTYETFGPNTVKVQNDNYTTSTQSPKRATIIFAALGFILSVCAVLLIVLINPTISDKRNFENYGVVIIDERSTYNNKIDAFTADFILKKTQDSGLKNLAIVSTITDKNFKSKQNIFVQGLKSISEDKLEIKSVSGIINDFDSFKEVKECQGVILMEKKGKTLHSDFDNTIALLEKYDIPVIGVII